MKGMAIILAVVGSVAGTVWATPTYEHWAADLGDGLYGHSFWVNDSCGAPSALFVEMEWRGVNGGVINQVQAYGAIDVHLEADADRYDALYPASGYRKSQDSWISGEFSHAVMEVAEGPNRYYVESGTEAAVTYTAAPHAYIVCDGDVTFTGRLGTGANNPFWTPVSGISPASTPAPTEPKPPPLTVWATQIGTSTWDSGTGIALDTYGNSYITGDTGFDGYNSGEDDALIVKCDTGGTVQWTRQIGSSEEDDAASIAVDGSGNSYVTGFTIGDLAGPNQGGLDAFIVKYDTAGTLQWSRQVGSIERDQANSIAVDGSGNSYVTGSTQGDLAGPNQGAADAFILKYDAAGTVQWSRQFGTSTTDRGSGITVDASGNSYITGSTYSDLGGPSQGEYDIFIAKYDSAGTVQWIRQMGTSARDSATSIAVDGSGNIYITGETSGDLAGPNRGRSDAFIVKCDNGGTVLWTTQIGTCGTESSRSIAVDGSGNIYITGGTWGHLCGPSVGEEDAFIVACDSDGTVQWVRQIGTNRSEEAHGIAVDGSGNIYITGEAWGDLAGPNQGWEDAFIMKIGAAPAAPGDSTVDGYTDGLDYVVWSSYYDPIIGDRAWQHGDFTGNGAVEGLDYLVWSSNYLAGSPGQVPEPSCALLLALGVLAVRRRFGA